MDEARQHYTGCLSTFERLGDEHGRANTLGQLGLLARQTGDLQDALRFMLEALLLFARLLSPKMPHLVVAECAEERAVCVPPLAELPDRHLLLLDLAAQHLPLALHPLDRHLRLSRARTSLKHLPLSL